MELTIFRTDEISKISAIPENIILEIYKVYATENDSVILEDIITNDFMLTDRRCHIEYQVDLIHHFVDQIPLETAIKLFLSFANNSNFWRSSVDWKIDAKLTAKIQSARESEVGFELENDLGNDLEIDDDGNRTWILPPTSLDIWKSDYLKTWKQLIIVCRKKVDNKAIIDRWEWYELTQPIWEVHPTPQLLHWRDKLLPDMRQEFDSLIPVAESLALEMEALFYQQELHKLYTETISNISTMRRMLKDTHEVDHFLSSKGNLFPDLQQTMREVKKRFAWHRAKKKVNEAEIAEAFNQVKKAEKLRIEAGVMLRQDWREVFSGEEAPNEETAKLSEIRR